MRARSTHAAARDELACAGAGARTSLLSRLPFSCLPRSIGTGGLPNAPTAERPSDLRDLGLAWEGGEGG